MKPEPLSDSQVKIAGIVLYLLVVGWFLFALTMGAGGRYVSGPHKPPLALGLTVALPVLFFVMLYNASTAVRGFLHSIDLAYLVIAHAGRIMAIDFIVLCAQGRLPAGFAIPAGLGDIVTGAIAIPLAIGIARRSVLAKKYFIAWVIFGITDLVTAVTLGILFSFSAFGVLVGNGPATLPMTELPRSLVPTFLVPLFLLLHLLALVRRSELVGLSNSASASPRCAAAI